MYHVMLQTGFGVFTTVSQHQKETEAVRTSKREAARTNQVYFVMEERGVSIPEITVDYKHS